jgi:hypothetical protein
MKISCLFAAALLAVSLDVTADGAADNIAADSLDRESIIELVSEKTTECRKEKDGSLCSNYFSEDGIIKQVMHDDGERKDGRWFVDDQERLCILWDGKIKPLCFAVVEQDNGEYKLYKNERHLTTVTGSQDGNPRGL